MSYVRSFNATCPEVRSSILHKILIHLFRCSYTPDEKWSIYQSFTEVAGTKLQMGVKQLVGCRSRTKEPFCRSFFTKKTILKTLRKVSKKTSMPE